MVKSKYLIIPVFLLLVFLLSCNTNDDTDKIYYAPFQWRNCGYIDNKLYLLLNGILYEFNEENLQLDEVCYKTGNEELCSSVTFETGIYLYSSKNNLYTITNELYFEVDHLNSSTWEKTNVLKFNAQSSIVDQPCIANDHCYYLINNALSYSRKVQVFKAPLFMPDAYKNNYEAEIIWESKTPINGERFDIKQLDTYDSYVLFTVESYDQDKEYGSDDAERGPINKLYIYMTRQQTALLSKV